MMRAALALALCGMACSAPPPRGNITPLDDGDWRVELQPQMSEQLVSLRPQHLMWQIYMDSRGDFEGFVPGQIKDAITVRSTGMECANWRNIRRTRRSQWMQIDDIYVSCAPPADAGVIEPAPVAQQVRSAENLGFVCDDGVAVANCTLIVTGRAVQSNLGELANPRPPTMGIEFRAEFDLAIRESELPTLACRSWEQSFPTGAFLIIDDDEPLRISAPDALTSRWRGPVQDCNFQGAL